jgi:hypothetical protein
LSAPRDASAFEVREALQQAGCPICALVVRSVQRWLGTVAYEQVNDIQLRAALRAARGFCNAHAHQWLRETHSVLGTAIIYRDVLHAALRELDAPRGGRLRTLLGGEDTVARERHAPCPACRAQREAEARYLAALLDSVAAEERLLDEWTAGLCRRHTRAALRRGGVAAERLAQQTRRAVERLIGELDEVIRKEDYRFRHEPRTDAERTAPARAVAWAAGSDGLVDRA